MADDRALPEQIRTDHAAIGRLADELLPALIAKLSAGGLGEIEVREGTWKARLRRPAGAEPRRAAGWAGQPAQGHAGHSHAQGKGPADGRRVAEEDEATAEPEDDRVAATSPAVGIYHPRRDLTVGMRIRAGDPIGSIDVLGIGEDVLAPVDGVVGASLAESGEAVEYGQELVRIELADRGTRRASVPGSNGRSPDPGAADAGRDEREHAGRTIVGTDY